MARALMAEAQQLKAQGRVDEALVRNRAAVAAAPSSAVAEHNLAATLGDLGSFVEAEAATVRALAKGSDAPETWLVRARALQGMGLLDEADAAFEAAIARRPALVDAQRELAQLRWMRTGDVAAATARLDTTPATPDLLFVKARLLAAASEDARATALLRDALAAAPDRPMLHQALARQLAAAGDAAGQLAHAETAFRLSGGAPAPARGLAEALLHAGRPDAAEALLAQLLARAPHDQSVLALLAIAWRLRGDPRHAALVEDPALVSLAPIAVPAGWATLPAFLAELAGTLRALHHWHTHPPEQSLRHGSQTQVDLARSDIPVVRALFAALDGPVRAHLAGLGHGGDPVRARLATGYRVRGAWSVLLRPGGWHLDHVHPEGWLSSAFYVDLPPAVERGHEGWLALGRPGVPTSPRLPPLRRLRPAPGHLALFPSYLWHGTEPFGGDAARLTVAFDLLPA